MNYLGESKTSIAKVDWPLSEADQLELDQITRDVSDNLILTNGLIANGVIKTNIIEPVDTSLVLKSLSASKKITIDGTLGTVVDGDLKCNNNQTTVGYSFTERVYTDQIYAKDYNINLNNNVYVMSPNTFNANVINSAGLVVTSSTNATIDTPQTILTGSLKTNQIIDPTSITLTTPSTILTGGLTTTSLATNLITDATSITLTTPNTYCSANLGVTGAVTSASVATASITDATSITLTTPNVICSNDLTITGALSLASLEVSSITDATSITLTTPVVNTSANLVVNGTTTLLNDVTITGDLTITGTNTILNTIEITVDDPIINCANDHLETTTELMGLSCAGVYALLKHPSLGWMFVKNENGILKTDLDTALTTYGEIDDDLKTRQYQFETLNVGAIRNISTTETMLVNAVTLGDRNALTNTKAGSLVFNKSSNLLEYKDNTGNWKSIVPEALLITPEIRLSKYEHGQTFVSMYFDGTPAYSPETQLIYLNNSASYSNATSYYRIQSWDQKVVPYNHGRNTGLLPTTAIVYTDAKYNRLVMIPKNGGNKLNVIHDNITGTIDVLLSPSAWSADGFNGDAYNGGSFDGKSVIFHPNAMSNSAVLHRYDCATDSVIDYANAYSGSIGANYYNGGCYHRLLNRIYLAICVDTGPWNAYAHYIDCSDYSVHQIGHAQLGTDNFNYSYWGGCYHEHLQRIYFGPYGQSNKEVCHFINPSGAYVEYSWPDPTTINAYKGGVYNPMDKCVYFIPYNASNQTLWHRINQFGVAETYTHTFLNLGFQAFSGGVLAGSSIYLQPFGSSSSSEWAVMRPFETDIDTTLVLLPPAPMTGATTGNWTVSSSTMYSPFLSWRAFNHNVSWGYAGDTTGYLSNGGYDSGSGGSTGAFSTVTANNGTLNGAWVDLKNNATDFSVEAFQIFVFDDQPHNRFPRILVIATSTDNGTSYYDRYRSADLGLQTGVMGSPAGSGSVGGAYWTYNSANQTLSTPIMYIAETNSAPYVGGTLEPNMTNIRFIISQISPGEDKTHFCEIRLYGNIN